MSRPPYDQRVADAVVRMLARTPVTPNMVTTFGLVAGLAAALMFAQGDPALTDWAALLFMVAVLNDHVDGQLARTTGRTSRFGHYYDHFAVGVTYVGMFVGAGIGLSEGALGGWAVALGLGAGLAVTAIFSVRIGVEDHIGKEAVAQRNYGGFEIEDTIYIVGPVTWLGGLQPFLVAAGIGAPLFLLWVVWRSRRDLARASAEDPGP